MAATLVVDVITNTSKAQAGLAKAGSSASSAGGRIKSSLKGIGGAVAGAFAVTKVVDFAKASVTAASDLNETMSKTQTIFGDSSQAVIDWSKNSSNALGLSQQAALDAASNFATFGKAAGLTGTDLTSFSTDLTGLAADMASFGNTTPQEAVDALGAALRGETEPIRKYGVMLDANSIGLEAMRLGLSKTKDGLSAHAKTLATQSLILKQTKDAQGDFAKTSGGLANQQRILQAKFENVKATLGTQLLPVVLAAVTAFQSMATFVRKNSDWLVPLAVALGVLAAAIKVATIAQRLFNITLMTNPIFWVVAAIVALVAALVVAYKKVDWFRNMVDAAFHAIAAAVGWAVNFIRTNWLKLIVILTGPIGIAVAMIIKYRDNIVGAFRAIPGFVRSALSSLGGIITAPFSAAWNWIKRNVSDPMGRMFSGIVGAIRSALSGVTDAITAPFSAAWNWIQDHVLSPIRTAWNGVANAINAIRFSVTVPSNVITRATHIAGKGFTFDPPNIPTLAAGGYARRASLAVIGERQPEIVAPEPMIRALMRDELRSSTPTIVVNVSGALDPDAVARQIERLLRNRAQRVRGVNRRGQTYGVGGVA